MTMDSISLDVIRVFKDKLHILHDEEDSNLELLLSHAYANIQEKCGEFPLTMEQGLSLVLERARYDYYGKLEYFDVNFVGEISSLCTKVERERRKPNDESKSR